VTRFTAVDAAADPSFFATFLDHASRNRSIVAAKPLMIEQLRLRDGAHALDVGCGVGDDAFDLASRVGPAGRVAGVDVSTAMIDEARRRASGRNLPVTFETADAQALPFADATFDAVRTERMLMHVPDPNRALAELVRVLRPGGRLAVLDMDWDSQFCDSPDRPTSRLVARALSDGIRNGQIGSALPRLFREHGLDDVSVTFHTVTIDLVIARMMLGGPIERAVQAGTLAQADVDGWWAALQQAERDGTLLYGFTAFIVAGTKRQAHAGRTS